MHSIAAKLEGHTSRSLGVRVNDKILKLSLLIVCLLLAFGNFKILIPLCRIILRGCLASLWDKHFRILNL